MVARSQGPHYDVEKFIKACRSSKTAQVWHTARSDAKANFNLYNDTDILRLIKDDKLPDKKFDNQAPLEKGPGQDIGLPVDAYQFKIGPKHAYIAFYKSHKGIWIIKSLHPPKHGENTPVLSHRIHIPLNFGDK